MVEKLRGAIRATIAMVIIAILLTASSELAFRNARATSFNVPGDYSTIQEAINAAGSGDIVNVASRVCYEHVVVNKTLSLVGDASGGAVIDGGQMETAVMVTADNVTISNFQIQGLSGLDLSGSGSVIIGNRFVAVGERTTESKANLEVFPEPPVSSVWRYLYDLLDARYTEAFQVVNDDASAIRVKLTGDANVVQLSLGLFYDENDDGVPQFHEFTGYASRAKETWVDLADPPIGRYIIKVQGYEVIGSSGHFDREIIRYRGYGLGVHNASNCRIAENFIMNSYVGLSVQSSYGIAVHGNRVIHNMNGIVLGNVVDSAIYGNDVSETKTGEFNGAGISLRSSYGVNMTGNSLSLKAFGINLWNSSMISVTDNELNSHGGWSIDLHAASSNIVSGNTCWNSSGLDGIRLMFSSGNVLSGNRIAYGEHSGILLWYDCYNNSIIGNSIQKSGYQGWGHGHGVEVLFSYGNTFSGNTIWRNSNQGILLIESSNNNLIENLLYSNRVGIQIRLCSDNVVYHNNVLDNRDAQGLDEAGGNQWNYAYPSGGNYWSDYTGLDHFKGQQQNEPGSDGIGDTSYPVEAAGGDHYPLMKLFSAVPMLADLNRDQVVDILDIVTVASAFSSIPGDLNWNPTADVNDDHLVDILDLVTVASSFGIAT